MESGKRTVDEYENMNSLLGTLHNEREKKKKKPEEEKKIEKMQKIVFCNGESIFMTPIDFISPVPDHFLTFRQLLYEDLQDIPNREKTLISGFFTTYCVEPDFFAPVIKSGIKVCLVNHGLSPKIEKVTENFTVITPKLHDKYSSFHAKLFLLKFPNRLRVVISSANLMKSDWSMIGQTLWFQDFFANPIASACPFQEDLEHFVKKILPKNYDIFPDLGINLSDYDFTTAQVKLIMSVPGRYKLPCKYGLSSFEEKIGKKYLNFTYHCSSVGAVNKSFLAAICKGFTRNESSKIEVIFPSIATVRESRFGVDGAGVFFLNEANYQSSEILKNAFCDISGPSEYPMIRDHLAHSKVIILHDNYEITDDTAIYIGSHNLSLAAWGRYEKSNTQIYIKNVELGVLFPSKENSKSCKAHILSQLPFQFPARKYRENDRPFFINTDT